MKYFSFVESSLKGGCKVELGPRTIIIGGNGQGKSRIVQSIELSSLGQVSDMEGRSVVKQNKALSRLFDSDGAMYAKATLSDTESELEDEFFWELEPTKTGFKRPTPVQPHGVNFALQGLSSTLGGSDKTVGAWLEKQVLGDVTEDTVLAALAPPHREDAKKFLRSVSTYDFMELSKRASKKSRDLKSSATKSENAMERMVEGVAPPLLDSQVESLKAELESLSDTKGVWTPAEYEGRKKELETAKGKYADLVKSRQESPDVPERELSVLQRVQAAKKLIAGHVGAFGDESSCFVCGKGTQEDISGRVSQLNDVEAELNQYKDLISARNKLDHEIATLEQYIKTTEKALAMAHVSDPKQIVRAEEIRAKLADSRAAERTWNNAEALRKQIEMDRATADRLNLLSREFKKAGKRLLDTRKSEFEAQVSRFLPEGEEFRIDLDASRVGFVRDGKFISALSGAEESRVLLALASAQEYSGVVVLVPRDRGWDPVTLSRTMDALSESSFQVIIMSTVEPSETVEGWTAVHV